MLISRRSFLSGSVVLAAGCAQPTQAQPNATNPESFGARGDGATDDTMALQRCLDAAPPGSTVQLRRGAVYRVDTNFRPAHGTLGGLRLSSRQLLDLNGAELRALPSAHAHGAVIQARRAHGWRIIGPGVIRGERDIHRGQGGEWGMGVIAFASDDWSIGPGVRIEQCWGDGVCIANDDPRNYCSRFRIEGVEIAHCRRNGISVVAGRDGEIRSVHIHDMGGAAPGGGIDLEGEMLSPIENRNIRITGSRIYRCAGAGIYVTSGNDDIVIADNVLIEGDNAGVLLANPARNIEIRGNPRIRSAVGNLGAAIRTVVYDDSHEVQNVRIHDNGLYGGGDFVLDIVGDRYENFVISGNRIHADNRGVLGIARLGRVTFTNNQCVMDPPAGREGHFFLYLHLTRHGGNVYRNRTAFSMPAVVVRTTDLGGDRYEGPRLTSLVER